MVCRPSVCQPATFRFRDHVAIGIAPRLTITSAGRKLLPRHAAEEVFAAGFETILGWAKKRPHGLRWRKSNDSSRLIPTLLTATGAALREALHGGAGASACRGGEGAAPRSRE